MTTFPLYLEWIHPPDPDGVVPVDYVCLLRHPDGAVTTVCDRHRCGLFDRDTWRAAFAAAGFVDLEIVGDDWGREVLIARRPD